MNELLLLKDLGMIYPTIKSKRKERYGLYKCFCNNEFKAMVNHIKSGNTKSCGCKVGNKKHNLSNHRLYNTWHNMMARCYNHKSINFKNYGGRGIKVYEEWHKIENFINDMHSSFVDGLTLDRIDNNGNYEPNNCRWTSQSIQVGNTRRLWKVNTSGYRGVYSLRGKYQSSIGVNNKLIHLGTYITAIDAAKARDKYIIDNNLEHTLNFKREE